MAGRPSGLFNVKTILKEGLALSKEDFNILIL
jgi:hypothetical protein